MHFDCIGRGRHAFLLVLRRQWALQGRTIVDHEEFVRYVAEDGRALIFYTDVDRLEQHMKELAPEDASRVEEFTDAIRRSSGLDLPVDSPGLLEGLEMGLKMLPLLGLLKKYTRLSVHDFARSFSDPFLREAFAGAFDLADFPMIGIVFLLALKNKGDAGYPVGGSLEFARAIERRYLGLGGEVSYNSRVEKILVENDRAVGVRLADGTEWRADCVISASDGHTTIFKMLEGKYTDDRILGYYNGGLEPYCPLIQVSIGVARDFSSEPHAVNLRLAEPIVIGGKEQRIMGYRHYSHDSTLAPAGQSVVVVSFAGDYDYWRALSSDRVLYEAEKEDIAGTVIAQLDERFPGFAGEVEAVDVATPMTYERYTGNWRGSFQGWRLTTETASMMFGRGLPKTLPGLADFHMIGQWTTVGAGLPPAAKDGRDVVKTLCRQDRKRFVTSTP